MKFKELVNKVEESFVFGEFIAKNPDAELVVGFFIIDYLSNNNKNSLDYKMGEKIFTFSVERDDEGKEIIVMNEDKLIEDSNRPDLEKIGIDIGVELDELKSIAGTRALDEGISAKFSKIIAVLQLYDGKQIWNLTCMLDGMIIINVHVDANDGSILKFDRKSMMDLIRKN